jgi:hypothetical protein
MPQAQVLSYAADSEERHSDECDGVQAPWDIVEQWLGWNGLHGLPEVMSEHKDLRSQMMNKSHRSCCHQWGNPSW